MTAPPTIHLMCGLVASGKTTLARELARALPAVRLSRDEWMLRLYGGRYDDPAYIERLGPCTDLLWETAIQIVASGSSVVLDWNFWSRERRTEAVQKADGNDVVLHWVDISVEDAVGRALKRGADKPVDAHAIDSDAVRHFASIFEPPEDREGITVERHR